MPFRVSILLFTAASLLVGSCERYEAEQMQELESVSPAVEAVAACVEHWMHSWSMESRSPVSRSRDENRFWRILHRLEIGRREGADPEKVLRVVMERLDWSGTARGEATAAAVLTNLRVLRELGCADEDALRVSGRSDPLVIQNGPYAGDRVEIARILPPSLVPELQGELFNLRVVPGRERGSKRSGITQEELEIAWRWVQDGLLRMESYSKLEAAHLNLQKPRR